MFALKVKENREHNGSHPRMMRHHRSVIAGRSAAACGTRRGRGLIFPCRGDLFLGRNLPCRKGAGRHPSCTFPRPPQSPEGLAPITRLVRFAELASDRWAVCIRLRRMVWRVGLQWENFRTPLCIRAGGGKYQKKISEGRIFFCILHQACCIQQTCRGFRLKTPGFPGFHWRGIGVG